MWTDLDDIGQLIGKSMLTWENQKMNHNGTMKMTTNWPRWEREREREKLSQTMSFWANALCVCITKTSFFSSFYLVCVSFWSVFKTHSPVELLTLVGGENPIKAPTKIDWKQPKLVGVRTTTRWAIVFFLK